MIFYRYVYLNGELSPTECHTEREAPAGYCRSKMAALKECVERLKIRKNILEEQAEAVENGLYLASQENEKLKKPSL